jgi:hypothetical protein
LAIGKFFKKRETREREKKKWKKKILKAHRNSNNNIIDIVEKISMIWIQWHHQYHKKYLEEKRPITLKKITNMTKVGHTSFLKASEHRHLWMTCITHFVHRYSPFLVLLHLSHQDLFNDIDCIIIEVSVCLQYLFFSSFISFISLL